MGNLSKNRSIILVACALLLSGAVAGADGPLKVGEHYPVTFGIGIPNDLEAVTVDDGMAWTLTHPGATYMALHFASCDLAPGESLVISDAHGDQSYTMHGRGKHEAGTFWARHVKGDTVLVRYQARAKAQEGGSFVVDEYVAGFAEMAQAKAICGSDDKDNAICYAGTHPTEYDRARAVARLLINGSSLCTGWLVSGDNHLLTNDHCIGSASSALNTDYEFMAEAPDCGSANCQLCWEGTIFSGATYVKGSASLDYALVQITGGNPAAAYGFMEIDNRDAVPGEEIYIPQHPGGRAKEFGIYSSDSSDTGGICRVYSTSEPPCAGSGYTDVGYYCDTEGGSSGSPVLARSNHKVIALHHCALCPNRGVPIDLVYGEISQYLGSCGDGSCGTGEDPCSCAADCGAPPTAETSCSDGEDNDCDSFTDCDDSDCTGDPACICDGDGTCEAGEDCTNCASDCISGSGAATCGNGVCEAADGEDCNTCPADCNGVTTGKPSGRFCCGGSNGCSDSRCTTSPWQCTTESQADPYCCGDGTCSGAEDFLNCAIDCTAGYCGDGSCDAGEDQCSCSSDCGFPPATELPGSTCDDGSDNDCDSTTDCADSDCDTDPACQCTAIGDPCTTDSECCSNRCHTVKGTCK